MRAFTYLQYRLLRGWLRRGVRSPLFWIVVIALGFVMASIVASALGGGPEDHLAGFLGSGYLEAGVAVVFPAVILIGLWRGTGSIPRASLADVVLLMGSPMSSRAHLAYLMVRDCVGNGLVLTVWVTAGFGGLLVQTGDPWMPFRMLLVVLVAVLLVDLLRYALWVSTEQVVARNPHVGHRLRTMLRLGVLLVAGGMLLFWLTPVLGGTAAGWREAFPDLASRANEISHIPPVSWAARVLAGDGPVFLPAIGLALLPIAAAGIALVSGRDFVEPISLNAERMTDARGKISEPGADIQWAAISQLGLSPPARLSVRPFGTGPWAILWASLVRWVRYEVTAAWMGLLMLGGIGVLLAVLIRFDIVEVYFGWAAAILMPLIGSVNAFLDELRKQFLFLTPGSGRTRLFAGAVTSVLDGIVASLMVLAGLAAFGAVSPAESAGLFILCVGLAAVSQGAVAAVQVILPYWTPQRMRLLLTFGASAIAATSALVVMAAFYIEGYFLLGMLLGFSIAAVSGAVMLVLAGYLFDRIEFFE